MIALMTVFTWSVVMVVIGQVAAISALIPSLVLGTQQAVKALNSADSAGSRRAAAPAPAVARDEKRVR
ncbi:hypothetical protein [Streptomyces sp. CB02923]|uniref:hypothetical protein n=1 Tax=Streptomyces sp. CB02923 TaxID=1718985 RepID=UPI001F5B2153|nr:hypothetical protein [Streptomyces sp. CB02923]